MYLDSLYWKTLKNNIDPDLVVCFHEKFLSETHLNIMQQTLKAANIFRTKKYICVFLAHLSQKLMGELIVYQSLGRPYVCPSTFSNIFSSIITGPIKLKFHMVTP